ncbi:MAG TPA: OmpA family protein, partial [Myxococcales bacterium]|nr:OmpA family protein [Myxococcales bacterium]
AATGATVTDALPAQITGATWTCSATFGGSCGAASGSGNLSTTANLPAGAVATYTITASVIAGSGTGRVTNVAQVAAPAGITDPDTTNNRAADTDDLGPLLTVTVQKDATGTGAGSIVSSPAAINCGTSCTSASAQFGTGTLISLTAIGDPGDSFAGWSGACAGTVNPCNLTLSANASVTAKFVLQSLTITASAPAGNGNISCTSPVLHRQSSTCTIAAASGYVLSRLTDNAVDVTAQVAAGSYAIVSVAQDHAVVATFLKDLSRLCGAAGECAGGYCVDGVCCNSACNGQCQACDVAGSAGTCTPATGAPHGTRASCSSDGSACGGACDGTTTASCGYPGPSTSCRGSSCSAGVATAAASCAGTGSCPAPATQTCTPYLCGATACLSICSADTDCIAGDFCSAGACVPKKANGGLCAASNQCGTGNCIDGVCCNLACSGQCQACDASGSVGTCVAVAGAPHGSRAVCASDGSACGGSCNGSSAAACAYPAALTSCRGASCVAGVATAAATCAGTGSCPAPVTQTCTPYICGATACRSICSVDTDCAIADYCSAGACVPKNANGGLCTASNQCGTGNCVDGVCCNLACNGQCQACDASGSVGTCVAVAGAPHGSRVACASDGSVCGGACDGVSTAACLYSGSATTCRTASCVAGLATLAAACDGAGNCPALQTRACTPYVCGASACLGNCAADPDCAPGDWCSAGVCSPRLPDGASCAGANQCTNLNCVDGVCCNVACGGQCEACNVPGNTGSCTAVTGAPRTPRAACASNDPLCGGACDGILAQSCAYPGQATSCRSASCAGGTATLGASCDGAGNCPALQTQACAPYTCGANACLGNCVVDRDCAAGKFCAGGLCAPVLALGATCSGASQCSSGTCVDGVCCNVACDGQCQACDVPGSAGTCSPTVGVPHGARRACASDGSGCGGACDGVNAVTCGYPGPGNICRAPSCAAGTAVLVAACDGAGRCPAQQSQPCGAYACGATACRGNCAADVDCAASNWCSAGVCIARLGAGKSCAAADQCATGNCVDGVCCDKACKGQCEACNLPGTAGVCNAAAGEPRGSRSACASDGTACGGACDGFSRAACVYPGAATGCRGASCAAGVATEPASCDGTGRCPPRVQDACNAYSCGPGSCRTSCATSSDCSGGNYCLAGACLPTGDRGYWMVAGTGCSSGGQASWSFALVLLSLWVFRRRGRLGAALAAALVAVGGGAARADGVNTSFSVDRFQPGAGAFDVLSVASPETAGALEWHGSAYASYARDPLRLIAVGQPNEVRLLRNQSLLHLGASVGLWDRIEIGAVLPVAVFQNSDGAAMLGGPLAGGVPASGAGDLRILPKIRLLRLGGLALGAAVPFSLPTGRSDAFLGGGSATATPTALAELGIGSLPVRLLANAGVAVRPGRSLTNLRVGTAMTYGLAAEAPLEVRGQSLAALATLSGEVGLTRSGGVERPLELLGALRWTVIRGLDAAAGGGPGLSIGYGTPRYRLFFSVAFTPAFLQALRTPRPAGPTRVEAVPPAVAPTPSLATVEQPGAAPVAAAAAAAEPPSLPASDPVPPPVAPLPPPPALAKLETSKIDLLAPVGFQRDRDVLLAESRVVLDAAAEVLRAHLEIARVRIEGHTDDHGKPASNRSLSDRRARAVMRYLVKQGIAASRLRAKGYGSARPVDTNATEEGRGHNRRVDLVILRFRARRVAARR